MKSQEKCIIKNKLLIFRYAPIFYLDMLMYVLCIHSDNCPIICISKVQCFVFLSCLIFRIFFTKNVICNLNFKILKIYPRKWRFTRSRVTQCRKYALYEPLLSSSIVHCSIIVSTIEHVHIFQTRRYVIPISI